jgi:hypothetical protein
VTELSNEQAADGQMTIMELQRATWRFAALRALVSCGCPEELRDGPRSVAELADRCGVDASMLARMLRSIAVTGLLRSTSPGVYELTPAGQSLLRGRALASVKFSLDPEIWNALGELPETVRNGQAPFTSRHGSLYDYLSTEPELSAIFDELMDSNHVPTAAKLAEVLTGPGGDLCGPGTVVDVGGGQGTFLAAILQANTDLRGVLFDLDRTVPAAREYLTAAGVSARCEVIAGNFFKAVPAGGSAYLVAHVVHNWDDEQATSILRTIRAAMPADGRLYLIEAPLPDDDSPHFGKDLDIRLLTMHEGKERSATEYFALLTEAGFRAGQLIRLERGECLLTASPLS